MSQQLVTLVTAITFVAILGSSSLFAVRHELSQRRAAHRRALARVRATAQPDRRTDRPVASARA